MFTGGGSAGHVTPNLALMDKLRNKGWAIEYIGSESGIEKQIIEGLGTTPYHPIPSGKFRRYFDLKNLKDPFKVIQGVFKSYSVIRKRKPSLIFSKGGFVSVPVVLGGWLNRVPVIIHESDMTPGLANKLSMPFATKICLTFPESLKHLSGEKAVHTGPPIREELFKGNARKALRLCDFHSAKPVLLVMGGSLGSVKINGMVRDSLEKLLQHFQIVHLCGKGHVNSELESLRGYRQFEYLQSEMPDILALADVVVCRAGSNSIFELLALNKPMVLIPLTKQASRGDQILNAESFEARGYSRVLPEEQLTPERLVQTVSEVYEQREIYIAAMKKSGVRSSVDQIVALIEKQARA